MSSSYFESNPNFGYSDSHYWSRWLIDDPRGRWFVSGIVGFTRSGYAVIDDFGNLREVPL